MHKHTSSKIREYAESLSIAFILAMIIRCFVLEAFKIPTGSMEPTLRGDPSEGDRILVSKFYYTVHDPERWDIFVFYCPDREKRDKHYIKRLIGKPGETIRIYNGNIYVNGKLAQKPPDVQQTLWRKLADEKMVLGAELLYRLNNDRGIEARWVREVNAIEYEEQLRLLENHTPAEYVYLSSKRRAESALPKKISSAGLPETFGMRRYGTSSPEYTVWLKQRNDDDPRIRKLNDRYLADAPALLKSGMLKAWDLNGFNLKDDGGLVAADDSASAVYRRKLVDGRFSDHLEWITDGRFVRQDPRIGAGQNDVGDIKLRLDVVIPESGGSWSAATQGNGMQFEVKLSAGNGGKARLELRRDGEEVASDESESTGSGKFTVTLANVDGICSAAATGASGGESGAFSVTNDYRNLTVLDGKPSTLRIQATKGVSVDDIELWRDVYYCKDTQRTLDGKREWGKDGSYVLRDNEFLALGDNSTNSADSRYWGPVPGPNIVGKAFFILTPLRRLGFME